MRSIRRCHRTIRAAFWGALLILAPNWIGQVAAEQFTSVEHGFKITFPAPPQSINTAKPTVSDRTRLVRYVAKDKSFRTSLTVVTSPGGAFSAEELQAALNASRDQQVMGVHGRLVSDKKISIDGHPGKEIVIVLGPPGKPHSFRYRARIYYVDHRQYLMSVIGTEKVIHSKRSDDFFNSFALVKREDKAAK